MAPSPLGAAPVTSLPPLQCVNIFLYSRIVTSSGCFRLVLTLVTTNGKSRQLDVLHSWLMPHQTVGGATTAVGGGPFFCLRNTIQLESSSLNHKEATYDNYKSPYTITKVRHNWVESKTLRNGTRELTSCKLHGVISFGVRVQACQD